MSGTEYTPTDAEIREYVTVGDPKPWEAPSPEVDAREARRAAAYDRWLAAHDAELAERICAKQQLHDAVLARNVADNLAYNGYIERGDGAYDAAAEIREG